MAIAVMPGKFVTIFATRRDKFVEDFWKISLQPRLELNRPDHAGGADVEDMYRSNGNPGSYDDGRNLAREVLHMTMPRRVDANAILISRH